MCGRPHTKKRLDNYGDPEPISQPLVALSHSSSDTTDSRSILYVDMFILCVTECLGFPSNYSGAFSEPVVVVFISVVIEKLGPKMAKAPIPNCCVYIMCEPCAHKYRLRRGTNHELILTCMSNPL